MAFAEQLYSEHKEELLLHITFLQGSSCSSENDGNDGADTNDKAEPERDRVRRPTQAAQFSSFQKSYHFLHSMFASHWLHPEHLYFYFAFLRNSNISLVCNNNVHVFLQFSPPPGPT